MTLKALPSKFIPVINAGHEEFTSKRERDEDVLSLGMECLRALSHGESRYLL